MKKGEWTEIDIDALHEIIEMYTTDKFKDKILEIAGLTGYKINELPSSLFVGKTIDIYKDFTDDNRTVIDKLNLVDREVIKQRIIISTCIIANEDNKTEPSIVPLIGDDHYDLFLWSWLGGKVTDNITRATEILNSKQQRPLQFWHYKKKNDETKYVTIFDNERERIDREEGYKKYSLVRVIDHEFFVAIINEYMNTRANLSPEFLGPDYPKKEDIEFIK